MNSHRYTHSTAVVVDLAHPLRDWTFRIAGLCLFLGVFAPGAWLGDDEPAEPEPPEATYQRGVMEGRRQMLLAYAGRNAQAFQAGMDEAFQRCTALPPTAATATSTTGGRK